METSYIEGLATHGGLESCVGAREDAGEALTEGNVGRVIEPRNQLSGVPTPLLAAIQGERRWGGCVVAVECGFRGGSGCGRVACDDTVSTSDKGRPSPLPFAKSGEGREGAWRHQCSR